MIAFLGVKISEKYEYLAVTIKLTISKFSYKTCLKVLFFSPQILLIPIPLFTYPYYPRFCSRCFQCSQRFQFPKLLPFVRIWQHYFRASISRHPRKHFTPGFSLCWSITEKLPPSICTISCCAATSGTGYNTLTCLLLITDV